MAPEHEVAAPIWRLKQQMYSLIGEVCPHCEHKIFPPRDICPDCGEEVHEVFQFSGRGEVFSFTTIYEAPTNYQGLAPFTVALIKLDEGPMITAQLTDLGDTPVSIGMPVEMVTRRMRDETDDTGIIRYGYKFRPRLSSLPMEASKSSI